MSTATIYSDTSVTYATMLEKAESAHILTEQAIKNQLKRFSENNFEAMTWEQPIENKRSPRQTTFAAFINASVELQHLIRLWIILESASMGKLYVSGKELSHFINYLASKDINIRKVGKDTLRSYIENLEDSKNKRNKEPFTDKTKYTKYNSVLRFFRLMKGHPSVASINGIEVMENPFPANKSSGKYQQIPQWKLEVTDKYFSDSSIPLVFRVWYWLMRMYGGRPQDIESYPLECVKELRQGEIATMKTYVGKQTGATNRIDMNEAHPYKIVLLNLKEPKQKMLYELIKEQQYIAQLLQEKIEDKGFLMTHKHTYRASTKNEFVIKYDAAKYFHMKYYWERYIKKLFKPNEHPAMKEYKHTVISKMATWGTHTHDALRDVANHQGMNSIDSYTKPATEDQIDMQKKIAAFTSKAPLDWMFKGEAVYDIKNILAKIMDNPYAHQLPGYGFCPDASTCGNHFECLGCDFLVPNPNLREYYYGQAKDYLSRAENLSELGKNDSADDRMAVATKFYSLYLRTFDEELKNLESVEAINLEEINFG